MAQLEQLHGDIFISVERVADNALDFGVPFIEELNRVIIHGVLHYCGFRDKTEKDAANKLLELLDEGVVVPMWAIETLLEEAK